MTEKEGKNISKIIVGVTGASGVAYGQKCLETLKMLGVETHLIMTKAAEMTVNYELPIKASAFAELADYKYSINDVGASIASGSFPTLGMIVAPCSIKTMSEIATGVTSNLLTRAADVILKERRRLVLMVRETPFHLGHLRTMTALTEMGAIVAPPLPAFYAEPQSVDDIITQSVNRTLDLFELDSPTTKRWGLDLEKGARH